MSWEHIFDPKSAIGGSSLDNFIPLAIKAGYKFIAWNGKVYFITDANTFDTGLKVVHLEGGERKVI